MKKQKLQGIQSFVQFPRKPAWRLLLFPLHHSCCCWEPGLWNVCQTWKHSSTTGPLHLLPLGPKMLSSLLFIYSLLSKEICLFGCTGSLLKHTGSSLRHAGFSAVAHGLRSSGRQGPGVAALGLSCSTARGILALQHVSLSPWPRIEPVSCITRWFLTPGPHGKSLLTSCLLPFNIVSSERLFVSTQSKTPSCLATFYSFALFYVLSQHLLLPVSMLHCAMHLECNYFLKF